ncbi:hypothetical protein [Tetrasphaera phage TJE1]|uniref:Uncharacterized protein n=1 Tax=Tetrasphaera phage TJE1 TaxID=981335 RepID=G4W980_9CAUD|nr:hypothetical protein G185_gp48 [Tetrasphaera phage TJE1]ADX42568.1 hypothetical protein [Tetrasphaera phage TJE1]
MVGKHHFRVERKIRSYRFKDDLGGPDSWDGDHNAKNNLQDVGILYNGGQEVFRFPLQTVANMPGARHTDTVAPGAFSIKWDVERRNFKGPIHGIVGAYDQDGQMIDKDSVQTIPGKNGAPADWARWIFCHSTRKNAPAPDGEVTRFAWSAGCFITTPNAQDALYQLGNMRGFVPGDLIPCVLVEVP